MSVHLEIIQKYSFHVRWKTVKNAPWKYIFIIAGTVMPSKGYLGNFFTLIFHKLHSPDPVVLETAKLFKNATSYFNDILHLDFWDLALSDLFNVQVQMQREEQKVLSEWPYRIKDHILPCGIRYFFLKSLPFFIHWNKMTMKNGA